MPDESGELCQRVVPPAPVRPRGGGRRRCEDHAVLAAIIHAATSGRTWKRLPPTFGPSGGRSHIRRFTEWRTARVWAKPHRLILDELSSRGDPDWSRCAIGSVNTRALKGEADWSDSRGSRQEQLEDPSRSRSAPVCPCHSASPAPIRFSGADPHGCQAVIPLVKGVPPISSRSPAHRCERGTSPRHCLRSCRNFWGCV